jgi:hypothetical protein
MYKQADGRVVESGREARQGYLGRPVLMVMVVGTALAFAALLGLWLGM